MTRLHDIVEARANDVLPIDCSSRLANRRQQQQLRLDIFTDVGQSDTFHINVVDLSCCRPSRTVRRKLASTPETSISVSASLSSPPTDAKSPTAACRLRSTDVVYYLMSTCLGLLLRRANSSSCKDYETISVQHLGQYETSALKKPPMQQKNYCRLTALNSAE